MTVETFYYTHSEAFDSSFVDAAYYNVNTRTIVFDTANGQPLTYTGVPLDVWSSFCDADSQGKFFQAFVKGTFEYLYDRVYDFFTPLSSVRVHVDEDHSISTTPEVPAGAVKIADASSNDKEYVLMADFHSFDDAYLVFSYAEALAKRVSLSVDSVDDTK